MNKLLWVVLVLLGASPLMAQQYHYYYQGEKSALEINTQFTYLLLDGVETPAQLGSMLRNAEVTKFGIYSPARTLDRINNSLERPGKFWAEVRFTKQLSEDAYLRELRRLEASEAILEAGPYFSKDRTDKIGISDLFLVKLKSVEEEAALLRLAERENVQVIGKNRFMPQWYTLALNPDNERNALEMANAFYETGQFLASEPDMMIDVLAECVNDPFFTNQWGHNNTGQWGGAVTPDINACDGWANWGTGNTSAVVAVLDHGFEQNHPDLAANNFTTGFDTESGTTPALVLGSHGTACAGIVAAVRNNNLGVAGVAPNCRIMSISNSLAGTPNSRQRRADGFNWAWQNGADVVSNSWSSGVQYAIIDDAIDNTLDNGRGGLGTVVVFSAGNGNGAVSYPANSDPRIICVGAMSPCGERKNPASCDGESWGSDFGTQLDVMAPGVKIPTTDRQGGAGYSGTDYTQTFNGTSSACPHVAGLAALILSLNPCLSHDQVADIIERSAQKVGGYAYANTAGRPNGTWDDEMGYGLIDIDAAMRMTRELLLQNTSYYGTFNFQVHGTIRAGSNVDPNKASGPVNIMTGNTTYRATQSISLEAGFTVHPGAVFTAEIISTSCADWDETLKTADPEELAETEADEISSPASNGELVNRMRAFPNPFSQELTLETEFQSEVEASASLYNLQGQKIADLLPEGRHPEGYQRERIQLNRELPAGIYLLRLKLDGQVQTQKLIKQ